MGFRPWIIRINTVASAKTSRMWIKPPNVYDETIPSNQRIIKRTKMVQSIEHLLDIPHDTQCVSGTAGSRSQFLFVFNSRRITKHEADQTACHIDNSNR